MTYFVTAAEHLRNDTGLPITSASYRHRPVAFPAPWRSSESSSCASTTPTRGPSTTCRSPSQPARCTRCSARTGRASRPRSRSSKGTARRRPGTVQVLDRSPWNAGREFRDRIGIVLQSSGVETEFTVREVIELYGGCYRSPRPLDEVVGLVGLDEKVDARIGSLSGGQRRRVDLALGIIGRPEVLFLDEPTTGFDPAARRRVVGPDRVARRRRHHGAAHDALPRRGRAPRRPCRRAVGRPADRRGNARAADQPGRAARS